MENVYRHEGDGYEHTSLVQTVGNKLNVRSCVGITKVVPYYDSGIGRSCYGNGGAKQKVFGFYIDGYGYWFRKKSDAIFAANWVVENDYIGEGDLEAHLAGAMILQGKELGKVYF